MFVPHRVQSNRRFVQLLLEIGKIDIQLELHFIIHVEVIHQ